MSNLKIARLPHPPKAVLCDLDGTLADSMGYLYNVYSAFMRHRNLEPTKEEFMTLIGPPLTEVVEKIKNKYGLEDDFKTLYRDYSALFREHSDKLPLMPGALEFLHRGKHKGTHLYVVTSASRSYAEKFLDSHGIYSLFHGIVGYEDVPMSKPHPAPYLKALKELEAHAHEAVAIEDSSSGVASATGAGVKTFWLMQNLPQEASLVEWRGDICQVSNWSMILELVYGSESL